MKRKYFRLRDYDSAASISMLMVITGNLNMQILSVKNKLTDRLSCSDKPNFNYDILNNIIIDTERRLSFSNVSVAGVKVSDVSIIGTEINNYSDSEGSEEYTVVAKINDSYSVLGDEKTMKKTNRNSDEKIHNQQSDLMEKIDFLILTAQDGIGNISQLFSPVKSVFEFSFI